jgi:hypothetical protein
MTKHTSKEERFDIYLSMLPPNVLSILGSLFIIFVFISFKSLHKFAFKLIFILSIFDLLSSIAFLIPTWDSDYTSPSCQVQAILISFFTFAGVVWTAFIAVSLYYIIAKNKVFPEKYWKQSFAVTIVLSLIEAVVPIITKSYGTVAGWCWITQTSDLDAGFYERYIMFYLPVWVLIFLIIGLYVFVIKSLKDTYQDEKTIKSLNKKLTYYPMILIICFLPYTIKGLLELIRVKFVFDHQVPLTMFAGIFRSLIGFLNAIVYGYTKKVKEEIRSKFSSKSDITQSFSVAINRPPNLLGSQCTLFSEVSESN